MKNLREKLVQATLAWEMAFGNAPQITTVLSEYDASRLIGCTIDEYSCAMRGTTAVQKGHDFVFNGHKYQVKGNRPSGKPGSAVTWVPKATNYDWDYLIWVLYDPHYRVQEAWQWDVSSYRDAFHSIKRLSPSHLRLGTKLV